MHQDSQYEEECKAKETNFPGKQKQTPLLFNNADKEQYFDSEKGQRKAKVTSQKY